MLGRQCDQFGLWLDPSRVKRGVGGDQQVIREELGLCWWKGVLGGDAPLAAGGNILIRFLAMGSVEQVAGFLVPMGWPTHCYPSSPGPGFYGGQWSRNHN